MREENILLVIRFQNLHANDHDYNIMITTMDAVKNFYKQFRILRSELPNFKRDKSLNDLIEWEDLPNMDFVREAIENANNAKHNLYFYFVLLMVLLA